MSSLLRPMVLEACQSTSTEDSTLRGRRRSSARLALNDAPRLFSTIGPAPLSNDSALCDDPDPLDSFEIDTLKTSSPPSFSPLSPLSEAHVSDYFTYTSVGRHKSSTPLYPPSPTEALVRSGPASVKASAASSETEVNHYTQRLDRLRWRLAAGFFSYFLCGWGDGVTGTVLPYFTADFHLNPMTSSLLFVGTTCGFFSGTLLLEPIMNFLGRCRADSSTNSLVPYLPCLSRRSRTRSEAAPGVRHSASQAAHLAVIIASIIHALHFIMIGLKRGYVVTFFAYAVAAFSRAILTASLNQYFAIGPPQALGFSYALWSLGGVLAPIVAQTVVSSGVPWPHFYFGSLVLSVINAVGLSLTFKPTSRENATEWREMSIAMSKRLSPPSTPIDDIPRQLHETGPTTAPRSNTLRLALSIFYVWALCILAMLYCGSETVTQGFMVTYLLGTRGANPKSAGYVTSGFWGGITMGRFAWGYFVPRLSFTQRKFTILACLLVAVVMHLLIWFIESNIQNAVSASVVGALYGPLFPGILRLTNDILPSEVHMISMGMISAFGSAGSALFPFITGLISSIKGIHTMSYLIVPLGVVLATIWSMFPTRLPTRTSMD